MKVLSPRGGPSIGRFPVADRPAALQGAVIGLLSNGKPNATPLLEAVAKELQATLGLGEPIRFDKNDGGAGPGFGAPDWMIERLSSGSIAVLTASGD